MSLVATRIAIFDQSPLKMAKCLQRLSEVFQYVDYFESENKFFTNIALQEPQIILLNLDLQPNDGIAILKELRQKEFKEAPYIIIYSDKQDDFLQELAYSGGADAFISFQEKPLLLESFLRNLIWRHNLQFHQRPKTGLFIDTERYLVVKNGNYVQLPRKEFQLLELLFSNSKKYFTKLEIAETLWKDKSVAEKRIIDVHIYNIRQLFGKSLIQSIKGKGYRLNNLVAF